MTDNLEELERLLAKATRGPWVADKHEIRHPDGPEKWGIPGGPQERANCAAIVALRNAAPSLIATAREVEGLRSVLSGLSSYLGAGLGDEATTPEQFDQRIRWGIEHQASAYRDRAASIVEECSKRPGTTWGEVKSAIQNDTFFPEPDNSEVEGLRAEVAKYRERWAMIDQLRGAEGCSVEIIHDNPDPGASNCAIYVTDNFGEDYSTYYGDTVDDCLRQAVASLNEGKPK